MKTTRILLLVVGDALVFIFFAIQGRTTHGMSLGASPILTAMEVAAPFAMPWFIMAALLGAFRGGTITHPGRMLLTTFAAWVIAGPIGLVVRTLLLQRAQLLSFAAVALGVNGALLLVWRGAFSLIAAWRTKAH